MTNFLQHFIRILRNVSDNFFDGGGLIEAMYVNKKRKHQAE